MAANFNSSGVSRLHKLFETSFGYARVLHTNDIAALQTVCELCSDFSFSLSGAGPAANAAQAMYDDVHTKDALGRRGDCIGLFDWRDQMIGMIAVRRDDPVRGDWYIGNLMFIPEVRSRGYGAEAVAALIRFAHDSKCERLLLSVMWSNEDGMRFWSKNGFEPLRPTEPTRFGQLLQTGVEMVRFVNV